MKKLFFIILIVLSGMQCNAVLAKEITIGNTDGDVLWQDLGKLQEILGQGDILNIIEPPPDPELNYRIEIKADDITIQSSVQREIMGVAITARNISKITFKDITLNTKDTEIILGIYADEWFQYEYGKYDNVWPDYAEYSDPNPCTIHVEGDVKLIRGYEESMTMFNARAAIYANVSLFIQGSGALEAVGGRTSHGGAEGIYSRGNVTIRTDVTAIGGSSKGGEKTIGVVGGKAISCNDLNIYASCTATGGVPHGSGLFIKRHLNVYENASLIATGGATYHLSGNGAYVRGHANIDGDAWFYGGYNGRGRAGNGLQVNYGDLNVTGNLYALGGDSPSATLAIISGPGGGDGISLYYGSAYIYGEVTAIGGNDLEGQGLGGCGLMAYRGNINVFGSLIAAGGEGREEGAYGNGSGIYAVEGALVLKEATAVADISDGLNCKPHRNGLSIRKEGAALALNWQITGDGVSGNLSDAEINVINQNNVIALDYQGIPVDTKPERRSATSFYYVDVSGHWAEKSIMAAARDNIISGVGNNRFEPERNITRAEFIQLAYRVSDPDYEMETASTTQGEGFRDVEADFWYYTAVTAFQYAGLLDNIFDGDTLSPETYITRQEVACIISNLLQYQGIEISGRQTDINNMFSDADEINSVYMQGVEAVISLGIMSGMGDGTFMPEGAATRAQATAVLLNFKNICSAGF